MIHNLLQFGLMAGYLSILHGIIIEKENQYGTITCLE